MPTPESGSAGKVLIGATSVGDVMNWELTKEVVTTRYASSETAGYKKSIVGVRSASGTIAGLWDASLVSSIIDGTSATLKLHLNATELYTVPAVISNFRLAVDINDGTATSFTASYQNNGAWTEPTLS